MRIAFVIYGRLDRLTGGYIYDRLLADELRESGHDVHIVSLPRKSLAGNLAHNFNPFLLRRILATSPDLILEDGLCQPSLALCNPLLRRRSGARIAALVHQVASVRLPPGPIRNLCRFLEKRFFSSTNALLCTSRSTLEEIRGSLRVCRPCLAARPGRDRLGSGSEAEVRRRCREGGPLRLLFLANVLPHKGLQELLHVLARWDRREWLLSVAGDLGTDPPYVRRIRRMIEQSEILRERVRLLGALTGGELTACIRNSHVLALPFSVEGFGMVFPEAMAFGLPAIACARGGSGEMVVHGENGFLIDPGEPFSLLGHLGRLLDEPGLLESMGLAALRTARAWPSWNENMRSARRFLESTTGTAACSSRGRPQSGDSRGRREST
jgi:glycosyltransferase involved in cell wall biosynthesis